MGISVSDDRVIAEIAGKTENFTPADLENLVLSTQMAPHGEDTDGHDFEQLLIKSLNSTGPSLSPMARMKFSRKYL